MRALVPDANLSDVGEMRRLSESLGVAESQMPEEESKSVLIPEEKDAIKQEEELRVDHNGQVQYIGPSSSYGFRATLPLLFGRKGIQPPSNFVMFGGSPVDKRSELPLADRTSLEVVEEDQSGPGPTPSQDSRSPGSVDGSALDALVACFFDRIHPDFPVLHEASFYEAFEEWTHSPSSANPAWLCGLLCVLILARRVAPFNISEKHEQKWWAQVEKLLPTCLFATSIPALQALLLAALHLHNNSRRDACWNLTGSAIRIAFAIGLHRDGLKSPQTPLIRELRKQIWWVVYSFDLMQVSSHDRPSAIAEGTFSVGSPRESILGSPRPPEYTKWSNRLAVMLARACRAAKVCQTSEEIGPLSPTARLLRDLDDWNRTLPAHLQLDVVDSLAPSSQRQILLLHVQYHYTVSLITRYALLQRATLLSKNGANSLSPALLSVSDACIYSGRSMCQHLLKLESTQRFNSATWWDIYYTFSASTILVLDIMCNLMQNRQEAAESRALLTEIAELSRRQQKVSKMPTTMQQWASVNFDYDTMIEEFLQSPCQVEVIKSLPPFIRVVFRKLQSSLLAWSL